MNPTAAYAWTFLRSLLIALAAVSAARLVCGVLGSARRLWTRRLVWVLLLAPLLTPALLIGYVYATISLDLVRYPLLNEGLYALLITARFAVVAVVIIYFAPPPPMSPQATWCAKMAGTRGRRGVWSAIGFWCQGPATNHLAAFAVVFILAFGEFEVASLMDVKAWAVWLFNAQTGGLLLSQSLKYALVPLCCELAVLVPVLLLAVRRRRLPVAADHNQLAVPKPVRPLAWIFVVVSAFAACLLPVAVVARHTISGWQVSLLTLSRFKEVPASLVIAASAALIAFLATGSLAGSRPSAPARAAIRLGALLLLCVPGLLGSLLLSLAVRAAFRWPLVSALGDGPIPLLLALVLLILPIGLLLRALMRGLADGPAVHLARQLKLTPSLRRAGRRLLWHLKDRAGFYVFFMMFAWAYFDLCTGVLLRPPQMMLAPDLLYNQMHYGQSVSRSITLGGFVAVPVLVLTVGLALRGAYHRWAFHG